MRAGLLLCWAVYFKITYRGVTMLWIFVAYMFLSHYNTQEVNRSSPCAVPSSYESEA